MPIKNGYYYPGLNYYNSVTGPAATANAAAVAVATTGYISGALTASNFNPDGLAQAELMAPMGSRPKTLYVYDDFCTFYNDSRYYPSSNGGGLTTNSQQQFYYYTGSNPNGYGNGCMIARIKNPGDVAGLTYGYNIPLGRFKTVRAKFGFWLENLSIANSESFSASIGIGLHGQSLLTSTRNTAYLRYCDHINSGNFQVVGQNNMVLQDTGVAAASGVFYIFDISASFTNTEGTANTGSWVLVNMANNTTASGTFPFWANSYVGSARETGLMMATICKNTGSSQRQLHLDFWEFLGVYF